jgi:hypothetical protein|tara:strand:- start:1434 stop:1712 length:279 start_codon:yes stop_codon:yes gene_type:complete
MGLQRAIAFWRGVIMPDNTQVFWDPLLTKTDTPYEGGYFVRNDLKDRIPFIEQDGQRKVVGIVVDFDSFDLELITMDLTGEDVNVAPMKRQD